MFKLKKALLQTINSLEEDLEKEKQRNNTLQHDLIILLDTNKELRDKMKDYENNIELLVADRENAAKKKRASSKNKESKN